MAANDNKLMTMKQIKAVRDGLRAVVAELTNGSTTALASNGDLNDVKTPGVYTATNGAAASLSNCPITVHFRLFVMLGSSATNYIQVLLDRTNNRIYSRTANNNTWTEWARLTNTNDVDSRYDVHGYGSSVDGNSYGTKLPDYDGAVINVIYYLNQCAQSVANAPADLVGTSAILVTLAASPSTNNQSCQQLLFVINGDIWMRNRNLGTWGSWTLLTDRVYKPEKYYINTCVDRLKTKLDSTDKFIVFGDSIATMSWVTKFRDAVGISSGNVVNKAVSGAVYGHTDNTRPSQYWVSTQVSGTSAAEWENAKLVIVAAGTNDAGWDIAASETKDQAAAVFAAIAAAAPNAHILVITPIRRGDGAAARRLSATAGAICSEALQAGCSVINGFDIPIAPKSVDGIVDDLTVDGDSVHPNAIGCEVYARSVIGFTQ